MILVKLRRHKSFLNMQNPLLDEIAQTKKPSNTFPLIIFYWGCKRY